MSNRGLDYHTVGEEWLAAYAAGGLSAAKRLVITCQAALQPSLSERLARLDHMGGVLLEGAEGDLLSDGFVGHVLDVLDQPDTGAAETGNGRVRADGEDTGGRDEPDWMPAPLNDFLYGGGMHLKWRAAGPGIERAPLGEDENGERLYLLRARGGTLMPVHGHRGEEWTLILQGGYHVGAQGYVAGDLHREDETCTHQPVVDADGPCVSLVAIEGKLKFRHPLLRMLQRFFGV